jgi:prolycopene isomerase
VRLFKQVRFRGPKLDLLYTTNRLCVPLFIADFIRQVRMPAREYFALARFIFDMITMREEEVAQWEERPFEEFFESYSKHPLVHMGLGYLTCLGVLLPTKHASAGEMIWSIQKAFLDRAHGYPKGGAVAVPGTFVKCMARYGGELLVDAGVQEIIVANGKATGVRTTDGRRFTARAVISTTSLKDTVLKLVGGQHFARNYVKSIENLTGSLVAVQAKIALDKRLVDVGTLMGIMTESGQPPKEYKDLFIRAINRTLKGELASLMNIYAPVPSNFDPTLAPEGKQIITACAVCPNSFVKLKDAAEKWIERLMQAMEQIVPGLHRHMIFVDTVTVKALEQWIGKMGGCAITTAQTPGQSGRSRPGHASPIRGLYYAGDNAGSRGIGVDLATQSGMDCADLVINDIRRGSL